MGVKLTYVVPTQAYVYRFATCIEYIEKEKPKLFEEVYKIVPKL